MLLQKELESFETTGDPNAMAELELRSKLVKVNEGLTVLKDMRWQPTEIVHRLYQKKKSLSTDDDNGEILTETQKLLRNVLSHEGCQAEIEFEKKNEDNNGDDVT